MADPASQDEKLVLILRELSTIKHEFGAFRDLGERRHLMLVNELAEVRIEAKRAIEFANDAKRLADTTAHEMHDTQRAVIDHTRGLVDRQEAMEKSITEVKDLNESMEQSLEGLRSSLVAVDMERRERENERENKLNQLIAADVERKTREDEREKIEDKRWKVISRWSPLIIAALTAVGGTVGYLIGHWKP